MSSAITAAAYSAWREKMFGTKRRWFALFSSHPIVAELRDAAARQ